MTPSTSVEQTALGNAALVQFEDDPQVQKYLGLGQVLWSEYGDAKRLRQSREEVWLRCLRQFKGIYEPTILSRMAANKSKTNIRLTRSKIKALDAKMMDMLFPAGDKNYSVNATPVPELTPDARQELLREMSKVVPVNAEDPADHDALDEAIKRVADERAMRMGVTIDDQLTECNYSAIARKALHSGHLYGTGVVKGVEVDRVQRRVWTKGADGKHTSSIVAVNRPYVSYRPIWNIFPDPLAKEKGELDYLYERHPVSARVLLDIARSEPMKSVERLIKLYVASHPAGDKLSMELDQEGVADTSADDRPILKGMFELVERWGFVPGRLMREYEQVKAVTPAEIADVDSTMYAGKCWLLGGMLVACNLHPFQTDEVIPYHFYYFDKDESSIWGTGVAELMEQPAQNVNAIGRLINDNAAISSGPQIEVNVDLLAEGEERPTELVPWKVYLRTGKGIKAGEKLINYTEFPNRTTELLQLATFWMQMIDEVTNLPRFSYANQEESGVTDTVGGLSIQMGNVNISLKEPVKNWDDGVTTPLITGAYDWNMQFNNDDSIKGDYQVAARGSTSLVAKELARQHLLAFGQATANQLDAPLIDRRVLLAETAKIMDLPPHVVKGDSNGGTPQDAQIAQMQQVIQQGQQLLQQCITERDQLKKALAQEQNKGVAAQAQERMAGARNDADVEIAQAREKALTDREVLLQQMQSNVEQRIEGMKTTLGAMVEKALADREERIAAADIKSRERIAARGEVTKIKVANINAKAAAKKAAVKPKAKK